MSFEVSDSVYTKSIVPFGRILKDVDAPKDITNVDCKEASKFVESLYGFSVNMINYINSHNVTVVGRDSNGPPRVNDSRTPHSKPYNLITLKDEVKYVGESEEGSGEELKYRIYVRGHPRRYRDENRVIRKVSWVSPHVRGPENAPWREQKYRVLATKLLREKAFNKMMNEKGYDGLKDF